MSESNKTIEKLRYEDAVAQIEAIIERIESGEVGLEATIADCEKGLKLITHCRTILGSAEQRIAELLADDRGNLTVEGELDGEDAEDAEDGENADSADDRA